MLYSCIRDPEVSSLLVKAEHIVHPAFSFAWSNTIGKAELDRACFGFLM